MDPLTRDDPRLEGWYHTLELGPGIVTKGHFDLRPVLDRYRFPDDLTGKRALDVGTANGFFAFELERRGASVVAIDIGDDVRSDRVPTAPRFSSDRRSMRRAQFELAHAALGSEVEYGLADVYDLNLPDHGVFDVVVCGSLLLHLRDPVRALVALRSVTRELLVVETASDPALEAAYPGEAVVRFGSRAEEERRGVPLGAVKTYWWMTGPALAEMASHAGFREVELLPPFELPPTGHPVVAVHARP